MMTPSQEYFLQVLSDFIKGRPEEEALPGTDWTELFGLAEAQSVTGLVYHQCRAVMPDEVKRKYLRRYAGDTVLSIKREEMMAELAGHLEKEGVQVLCTKGAVFRDYYSLPPLRSMGDIDVLIHREDREKTDRILRSAMGFGRFIDDQAVWTYWKEYLYVEVHDHMFYEELASSVDYRSYFDSAWTHCRRGRVFGSGSPCLYIPEEEIHFLYLMAHTAKHIVNSGSGFRAYLDMVLMCRACEGKLDWERIGKELEKLGLLKFTKNCFRLCERWFGVDMPLDGEPLDGEFYEAVTEKTFEDGVFGLENAANKRAGAAKEIKRAGRHYYLGAAKRVARKLFPPYGDMQVVRWYSFLDGRPWLLPAAWVYRWFYCLIKKGKHSRDLLLEPFVKKEEVADREAYLERWGL